MNVVQKQMDRYRNDGYPEHNGLFEGIFWIRELNNPRVIIVMETWWQEVANGSKRD